MARQSLYIVLLGLIIACGLDLSCTRPTPPIEQEKGITKLDFDRTTGNLTLKANEASLFMILQQLNEKHQIDVTVPDLTADQVVTANIVNAPLNDALTQFLPPESRFYFTVKEAGEIPQELTPQTFPRFEKFLNQVGEIDSGALQEAYAKRNQ